MAQLTTPRWGTRYPDIAEGADVPLWLERLALDLDDHAKDDQGLLGDLPESSVSAPGKRGRYYWATDTQQLFRDNGLGWDLIGVEAYPGDYKLSAQAGDHGLAGAAYTWLLCDGRQVNRATYQKIWDQFRALGGGVNSPFGNGDGVSTFNLPDIRGRVAIMPDGAAGRLSANDALGNSGGEEKHPLTIAEMPSHKHVVDGLYTFTPGSGTVAAPAPSDQVSYTYLESNVSGGGQQHNTMQPFIVAGNWFVRAL